MKKITLFFLSFMMVFAYANAQTLPTLSTDDTGPWYYMRIQGSDANRFNKTLTVFPNEEDPGYTVTSSLIIADLDTADMQLFRVESAGDGKYYFINKASGEYINSDIYEWESGSKKEILLTTPNVDEAVAYLLSPSTASGLPAAGNFWIIQTPEPLISGAPYWHVANSGYSWFIIHEGTTYGTGLNSSFEFLDFNGGLVVAASSLDFGTVIVDNASALTSFTVAGIGLGEDISFAITDGDEDWFGLSQTNWDPRNGGTFEVFYYPEAIGTHSATLTFTSGSFSKEVILTGESISSIPVVVSPDASHPEADANGDIWYRMQFNKRGMGMLTDMGDGEMLESTDFDASNDAQLWKVIENGDAYAFINKATGNFIDYIADSDRYIASATAEDNVFSFLLRSDFNWQVRWNDYINSEGAPDSTYFNKTAIIKDGPNVTTYKSLTDPGNSMAFLLASETYDMGYPKFSDDATAHWYMIQFVRTKDDKGFDRVFEYQGLGASVKQLATDIKNADQYWKLVGNKDEFRIVNYNGEELGKGSNIDAFAAGEGSTWKIAGYQAQTWALYDIGNDTYANDHGQATAGYYSLDAGGEIRFIAVDEKDIEHSNIDEIDFANDPVIATTYYNLQGVMVQEPNATGVYIVRYKHESGKYSARKILYRIN